MDPYEQVVNQRKKARKRYIIMCLAFVVLVVVIASVAVAVAKSKNSKSSDGNNNRVSSKLSMLCQYTLYPDTCISSVSSSADYSTNLSVKELVALVVEVARNHSQVALAKLQGYDSSVSDPLQKAALSDCIELFDSSLSELNDSIVEVKEFDKNSLSDTSGNVQSWLSGALTDLETCVDGFANSTSNDLKSEIRNATDSVKELVSNSLAIVNKISLIIDALKLQIPSRRLLSREEDHSGLLDKQEFPRWFSASDRRLLQSNGIKADVVVAQDGTGKFKKIQDAIDDAPSKSKTRYVIYVKRGLYYENVEVPKTKTKIMIVGDGIGATVVSGSRNVVDGSTTFRSATFAAVGTEFIARDIEIRNTAGPEKHQAVALRSGADKSVFYRCKMDGYQDTLYAHSLRQFYKDCVVVGTVDFIFGNGAVVLQGCTIMSTKPMDGQKCIVTAQGRTDPNMNTGIVIHRSVINATASLDAVKNATPTYLGRPWKEYSRTVVMLSYLGDNIHSDGWFPWNGDFALNTLTYREYNNTGPASDTSKRVNWSGFRVISKQSEAYKYTVSKFIGSSIPKLAGVPYIAGL